MGGTISVNGAAEDWADVSLLELVVGRGIDPAQGGVAVARNGEVVPRADWAQTRTRPEDRIEIVHIVRGG